VFGNGPLSVWWGRSCGNRKAQGRPISCLHLKDIDGAKLKGARERKLNFHGGSGRRICADGQDAIDFATILKHLQEAHFDRWVVVEQEVLEGGEQSLQPLVNASAGPEYLQGLGIQNQHCMSEPKFDLEKTFRVSLLDEITDIRVNRPEVIEEEAQRRQRRPKLTRDGKLVLAAIDHPARAVTKILDDDLAMGDRHQFLGRARRVLEDPNLDGVLGSTDILEELLILSSIERKQTGKSFLDGRVLSGSMNRGGLAGTAFEMEDTFTGISAARLAALRCDAGKMLYRVDSQDPSSGRTITACAQAINSLREHRLAAFVEPLPVVKKGSGYANMKDAASLIRQIGVASALGDSSAHVWLKIPVGDDMARICRATTLPILLLGGPARQNPVDTLRDFANGLAAGPRIRGAIVGRNLLFPGEADPLPMCCALTAMVHEGATVEEAARTLGQTTAAARG